MLGCDAARSHFAPTVEPVHIMLELAWENIPHMRDFLSRLGNPMKLCEGQRLDCVRDRRLSGSAARGMESERESVTDSTLGNFQRLDASTGRTIPQRRP